MSRKDQQFLHSLFRGEGVRAPCAAPAPEVAGERGCGGKPGSPRTLRRWGMWKEKALTWLKAIFSLRCYQPCRGSQVLCRTHLSGPSCSTYSFSGPAPVRFRAPPWATPTATGARTPARLLGGLRATVRAAGCVPFPRGCWLWFPARVRGGVRGVAVLPAALCNAPRCSLQNAHIWTALGFVLVCFGLNCLTQVFFSINPGSPQFDSGATGRFVLRLNCRPVPNQVAGALGVSSVEGGCFRGGHVV